MPEEKLEQLRQRQGSKGVKVWAVNWPVLEVFLSLATQWRTVPITTMKTVKITYLGLEYTSLAVTAAAYGLDLTPEVMRNVQAMEAAACRILNGS
tara:strand:+ start:14666 stop:14950 length:285 start_codon:yes stop_codon:yes gene_type:complete